MHTSSSTWSWDASAIIPSCDQSNPRMLEGQHFKVVISDILIYISLLSGSGEKSWASCCCDGMK